VALGRRLLEKEARRHKLALKKVPAEEWQKLAQEYGCHHTDELYARVGFGKYAPRQVLTRLFSEPLPERPPVSPRRLARLGRTVARVFRLTEKGLPLHDTDLMMYRARCCSPIRGEAVVGYITRGRGIAVHAKDCPNVQNLLYNVERRMAVDWAEGEEEAYPVRLAIHSSDRPGLLTQISGIIANNNCNIRNADVRTDPAEATGVIDVVFDVQTMKQLDRIVAAIRKVPSVRDVHRVLRI
jgi:GTP pyrophosphokinase